MIGQVVSHYRILEELGGGGMGVVYKAEDTRLGRQVALKFLPERVSQNPDAIKRFQQEARAASALNHPNICTIYDLDQHEGQQFIVMELLEGQTLKHHIAGRPLATEEILRLAAQIADGLAVAHEHGIIHRDIKPANLFLTQSGLAKVLDFGVAKLLPKGEDPTVTGTLTEVGTALGTLAYMAPEQVDRKRVDARTDIYALGCVLYEMATGQRPFQNEPGPRLLDGILHRRPQAPRDLNPAVPAELEAVIMKCLEKKPEDRYQSARELASELRRPAGTAAQPRAPAWGSVLGSARRPLPLGIGLVLIAVVLSLAFNLGGLRERLFGASSPRIDSLAVLPLKNLSGDPEQDYLVEGMHEALIAELSKISALKVISRTSAMHYKGTNKRLPQIARELGVTGVIEGSVLREGDQVRITVQLIHGPSDRHLWAQSFDRELRGILALYSDVARAIANKVKIAVVPTEPTRLAAARPVDPEVYEAYARGRYHWNKRTIEGLEKSLEYFRESIDKDPNFALAYTGLADTYILLDDRGLGRGTALAAAKTAALKALEIDSNLAEAHSSLGSVLWGESNWTGAEKEFLRALELNPNDASTHHRYAHYLGAYRGQQRDALRVMKRAQELDPLSLIIRSALASVLAQLGDYEQAIEQERRILELDPNFAPAHGGLGRYYARKGMYEKAIAELRTAITLGGHPAYLGHLGHAYALAGQRDEARKVLKELEALGQRGYFLPYTRARVYVGLGEHDRALQWLEKAYEYRKTSLLGLKSDPDFDPLRSNPRFQDLLRRMNFPK